MNAADPNEVLKDEATLQLDAHGNLRHLLTLKGLDKSLLIDILDDAQQYLTEPGELPARGRSLVGRSVANLFFEASTRTRASFDLAGKRLGADVLNLDVNTSSRKKGESILDTIPRCERRRARLHCTACVAACQRPERGRIGRLTPDAGTARYPDNASTQGLFRKPCRCHRW
jgi:hypothetical protein